MREHYFKRPFKVRNADEYDLSQILKLFVSPLSGLTTPFDFENNIIKGRMGSGKTMYLRANHAYYLYSLVPSLINKDELILPVMIRLSDFQHIKEPSEIYRSIIIKIIEELSSIYLHLENAKKLARIHMGVKSLPEDILRSHKIYSSMRQLKKLGSEEYVERISSELGLKAGIKPKFFDISAEFKQNQLFEIKQKSNPGIKDVEESHKNLLGDQEGKIILLLDEAGSLDRKFFKGKDNDSFFEILMNQFRTAYFIRTKIAIYPNSYQDILTETRYGDVISLEENIMDSTGYESFYEKTYRIISNYLNPEVGEAFNPEDLFELNQTSKYGDCLEQLINASNGNMRRLIQLLDATMETAFSYHQGQENICLDHTNEALKRHAKEAELQYTEPEREFLQNIVKACKSRSTYKFQFPYMSPTLYKYTSKSQEYNLINVIEIGTGRKSTTYAFDYCFCVAHDIPTHYVAGSERINKQRNLIDGRWVPRVAKISEDVLQHAAITTKIDGAIEFISGDKGFIVGDDDKQYYFNKSMVIKEDSNKPLLQGRRVRFIPFKYGDNDICTGIELL